ncbi:MAG TPA: acyl-CoA dehydrogenase family protein [Solirubrobacteraceae bacterium]|nr:acyl-CoA dehydrogenase family protein [Solirubrobacteraceae bacterium]
MNLALSDEQILLREAAQTALSRHRTLEAARAGLEDPAARLDLWPTAVEAGWPGLLVSEARGGAELGAFDAMLVAEECGRVLAPVPLLGLLPATAILDAAGHPSTERLAGGEGRAAFVPARPPCSREPRWTAEPDRGLTRAALPAVSVSGQEATLHGAVPFVPDLPGAEEIVLAGAGEDGAPVVVLLDARAEGVAVEPVIRYDATRPLGDLRLNGARGEVLGVGEEVLADAWYLGQALIGAESIGSVQACLERSVAYAKERFTFGRAIGSYQAIKHELVEILRRLENARGLQYYAGWARESAPEEFPLAACALRSAAGEALDFAARAMINVHGGIGATWEHDAPLYFRRAELSRRLLGGTRDATDRVAECTLAVA